MDMKTTITAIEGRQDLVITRIFDLPVHTLYRAFAEAQFVAKWMNTHVEKLDHKSHGSYEFVTTDPLGGIHRFAGVIHQVCDNEKIVRTFEMIGGNVGATLEVLHFYALADAKSKLQMHVIYQSEECREAQLKLPFAWGLNMAHNRLEEVGLNVI